MSEPFLDQGKVAAFWDQARAAAAQDQQTGYLQDEWPAAVGEARLRGEVRDVSRWLDRMAVRRAACLDVGCGVGAWLEALAGRFQRAHGIDLSREMVASAAARAARLGLGNVTVEHKSVSDLGADQRYDLVFVGGVLMYLNDDEVDGMVGRLAGLVRPGGALILRETTARTIWYRDTPLGVGLYGDKTKPRPPYYAIYRPPASYRDMAVRHGLEVVRWHPNRHYKIADLTEGWLRAIDRLRRGALARDHARAERVARRLDRLRHLTLLPQYYVMRAVASWSWRLNNYWYVCRRAA